MADILLLEPNYKNKYPPLGLMKIAFYHKEIKKDYVRFAKGNLPEIFKNKKWDRVYVTTLFTFEWESTIRTINYAKEIVKNPEHLYIGGIAATLLADEFEKKTGIRPVEGLLNENGKIGYSDDGVIDTLTPDYSILDDVDYKYPFSNGYFTYTTRGCGMKCGFCAVQILEPKYQPRISIKEQIAEIDRRYGPKRDLLLMDNNVLKSPEFDLIIDELIELGFGLGATIYDPKLKRHVLRHVDFNQGLDAFLLNETKAKRLGELAIRPARIAFDHIEDKEIYLNAIRLCAKYGIKELSNYTLYNSEKFTGKGRQYNADYPQDLYNRLKITIEIQRELNRQREENEKVSIFSFPMRYIPLEDKSRGNVGVKWNKKYLRAIQAILVPTQGKGVSNASFFEAAFGTSDTEFLEILAMPEHIITIRGKFVNKRDESDEDREIRYNQWIENREIWSEWKRLFDGVNKDEFINVIKNNDFNYNKFSMLQSPTELRLYLHYFTESQIVSLFRDIKSAEIQMQLAEYCLQEFPIFFSRLVRYLTQTKSIPYKKFVGFLKIFGDVGLKAILAEWLKSEEKNDTIINSLQKALIEMNNQIIDVFMLHIFKLYCSYGLISTEAKMEAEQYILCLDKKNIREFLLRYMGEFSNYVTGVISRENIGTQLLLKEKDYMLKLAQDSLFD